MNISKYILILVVVLLFPIMGYAQKVGGKYIVSTKDTTRIVSNRGANDPENEFLFRKKGPEADSVYAAIRSKYTSLEAATLDVDRLITEIENDQTQLKTGNSGLAYRLSKSNIENREKEKRAKVIADSLQQEMMKKSAEELALRYAKYGDKPSYYINGAQVQPEVISLLSHGDIIERNMKIQDNSMGNPNGEIWITVTDKAAHKIKLATSGNNSENATENTEFTPAPSTHTVPLPESKVRNDDVQKNNIQPQPTTENTKTATPKAEKVEKTKKADNKKKEKTPLRSVKKIKEDRKRKDDDDKPEISASAHQQAPTPPVQTKPEAIEEQPKYEPQPQPQAQSSKATDQQQVIVATEQEKPQPARQSQQTNAVQKTETTVKPAEENKASTGVRRTRVKSRTVNNKVVSTEEPVDGDSDSLN